MKQQDQESMDFEEMVQRAINAKSKAGLRSSAMVRDLDICCPWSHRSSNITASKVQTQGKSVKEPCLEESRPKEAKLPKKMATASPRANVAESLEQGKKDRKNKKRRFRERKEQTPATGTNITNAGLKKKYPNITYYNYDKKGHYSKSCSEPPKNECRSWQSPCQWLIIVVKRLCSKRYLVSTTWFDSRETKNK